MSDILSELVSLGRTLGDPAHDLAILAEGNVSGRADDGAFFVKASGFSMRVIGTDGFVKVRSAPILASMGGPNLPDAEIKSLLAGSRVDTESSVLPSVETFMHAYLLSLTDVRIVGHTHPSPLLSLLCTGGVEEIARQRLFPDDVVCCGPESCFVPYVDPGLPLARAIRDAVLSFIDRLGETPKTIWLQNHGLIALGRTVREVESATFMSTKAARIWLAALSTGRPLQPLSAQDISRIHTRPDEHYRQRVGGL